MGNPVKVSAQFQFAEKEKQVNSINAKRGYVPDKCCYHLGHMNCSYANRLVIADLLDYIGRGKIR